MKQPALSLDMASPAHSLNLASLWLSICRFGSQDSGKGESRLP